MFRTSSTEWTNWYNGIIDSASIFDRDNIHSIENNLPLYVQEISEYNDLKKSKLVEKKIKKKNKKIIFRAKSNSVVNIFDLK